MSFLNPKRFCNFTSLTTQLLDKSVCHNSDIRIVDSEHSCLRNQTLGGLGFLLIGYKLTPPYHFMTDDPATFRVSVTDSIFKRIMLS